MKHLYALGILIVSIFGLGIIALSITYSVIFARGKFWKLALAIDSAGNVATNGDWGNTISYRAAVAQANGKRWGCLMCKLLDWFDEKHCDKALKDKSQQLARNQ